MNYHEIILGHLWLLMGIYVKGIYVVHDIFVATP